MDSAYAITCQISRVLVTGPSTTCDFPPMQVRPQQSSLHGSNSRQLIVSRSPPRADRFRHSSTRYLYAPQAPMTTNLHSTYCISGDLYTRVCVKTSLQASRSEALPSSLQCSTSRGNGSRPAARFASFLCCFRARLRRSLLILSASSGSNNPEGCFDEPVRFGASSIDVPAAPRYRRASPCSRRSWPSYFVIVTK